MTQPAILGASGAGAAGGGAFYPRDIPYSMLCNDDDTDYLTRTLAAGNQDIWTVSAWIKPGNVQDTYQELFSAYIDATHYVEIQYSRNPFGQIAMAYKYDATLREFKTTALYRDPTNHLHIVFGVDTTQGVAADRIILEVNGIEVIAFVAEVYPPQNQDLAMNGNNVHDIGAYAGSHGQNADAYMSEFIFIDGTQYAASDFGELKNGVWVPKESLSLTYGTNGFKLDFSNAGDLGEDSANSNDFTVNGTPEQTLDTPTNNHCVINSITKDPGTLTYGNTVISGTENGEGTFFVGNNKWAWKVTSAENGNYGIISDDKQTQYVAADVSGEGIEFELDLEGMTLKKRVDGGGLETIQDPIVAGKNWAPYFESAATVDFGASGFSPTDGDYLTLTSANIATTLAILDSIDQPGEAVYVNNREGTGAEATVSDVLFDVSAGSLITIRNRDAGDGWRNIDTIRGATWATRFNDASVSTEEVQGVKSLTGAGYVIGTDVAYNTNNETYMDWVLRLGSQFGFVMVDYEGNGANRLINHPLGVIPLIQLIKDYDAGHHWSLYHGLEAADPEVDYKHFSTTGAFTDDISYWNDIAPTSTQFSLGTHIGVNENGKNFINYLFADIPGLVKCFVYTGNGSADGPFVPLGFRAKNIIMMQVAVPDNEIYTDVIQNPYNVVSNVLYPNGADVMAAQNIWDITSQGIKLRIADAQRNHSGRLYVGIAWADQFGPYSNAR